MKYLIKFSFSVLISFFVLTSCSDSEEDAVVEETSEEMEDETPEEETPEDETPEEETTEDETPEEETPEGDYDISSLLALFEGTDLSYEIADDKVIFTTSDLPNHGSPYWGQSHDLYEAYNGTNENFTKNKNVIEKQNIVFTISLNPEAGSGNNETSLGPIGLARNGIVFFNQYAGPDNEPLTSEIDSFDQNSGHPTGTSIYHYHIEPLSLTEEFGADAFLGVLADGFPVYGPMEDGEAVTNDDLDEFHGHVSVTAEFPDGIYHYHITDADPYLNGNGFYGRPGNITQ